MNSQLMQRAKALEARNRQIRKHAAHGMSYAQIGRKFGLTRQRVQQIVSSHVLQRGLALPAA